MNHRRFTGDLKPPQCKRLVHAWHTAARFGRPLNRFISIRPATQGSPIENAILVEKFWDKLGGWCRYNAGGFWCVLTREAAFNGISYGLNEHFHVLVFVPRRKYAQFETVIGRWFPGTFEADVRAANQNQRWNENGKIRSAIGYLTKQRTPQATYRTVFSRQRGGLVLGKRYKISNTLRLASVDGQTFRPGLTDSSCGNHHLLNDRAFKTA